MRNLNKKKIALLTACVVSAVGHMAFAAEADNYDEYSGADYVVTATKTQIEKKEVPVAVEVISEQKIKDLGAYSVQDALRLAANVDVQDVGMTGNQVQIRGNSTKYTLILVNGKRLSSENTSTTANVYELKRINIADVERIEVLRGNSSALYGSDALGGVINIITKKATKPTFTVNTHAGSKDNGMSFNYASGQQGKVSFKMGGAIEKVREEHTGLYDSYSTMQGMVIRKSKDDSTNMYGIRHHLNTDIQYDFDEDHNLDLEMNFMREQFNTNAYASNGADYTVSPSQKYEMGKYYNYNNTRSEYALTYNGKDGKHDYNFRTYYSQLRKDNDSTYINIKGNSSKLVDFDQNNYSAFVVEGKDTYTIDEKNTLTYGAEYKKNTMDGTHLQDAGSNVTSITHGNIIKSASEVTDETIAVYLQDELKLNDKLLLIPAVRVDHHDAYGTHASPKIGATYSFSDNSRLKINYGKGFRAPTLYELYANMAKSGMAPMTVHVLGNKDLEPEKSTNFDISLEAEKGKVTSKVSYFHNDIKNMIDGDDYDGPETKLDPGIWSKYINRGDVEISGAELEVGYNFDNHWSVSGSYNYLDAKDKNTGDRLTGRARHNGVVQLTYTDAKENPLTVNLYNRYYIDYHYTNSESAKDVTSRPPKTMYYRQNYTYGITGVMVNKQINKNFRIYGGVDNIFDKQFFYDTFNGYYVDGRTWRVGAEMTF